VVSKPGRNYNFSYNEVIMTMTFRPKLPVWEALKKIKMKKGFKTDSKVLTHVLLNFSKNETYIRRLEQENNDYENQLRLFKSLHVKKKSAEQQINKFLDYIEY
jgi:hypothetical protein